MTFPTLHRVQQSIPTLDGVPTVAKLWAACHVRTTAPPYMIGLPKSSRLHGVDARVLRTVLAAAVQTTNLGVTAVQ